MIFFAEFLAATGVFERRVSACPLEYRSGNAPDKRDVLGTLLLGLLAGHRRYAHIMDASIKPLYGRQEGAEIGYNPSKPMRPSHLLHTFWVGNLRLVLDVQVSSGKQHTSVHAKSALARLLDEPGAGRGRRRADHRPHPGHQRALRRLPGSANLGDRVAAGAPLARLDTRELQLQATDLSAERARYQAEGDRLFRLARVEGLYAVIHVPERDMRELPPQVRGTLRLLGQPSRDIPFSVEALVPVAQVRGAQGSQFALKVKLDEAAEPWWRPGMSGLARVDAGDRAILWIWTHRLVDQLRLWFWW